MDGEFPPWFRGCLDAYGLTAKEVAARRGVRPEQLSRIVNAPQVSAIEAARLGMAMYQTRVETQKKGQRVNAG